MEVAEKRHSGRGYFNPLLLKCVTRVYGEGLAWPSMSGAMGMVGQIAE